MRPVVPCRVRRGGTGATRSLRGSDGTCALRTGATRVPRTRFPFWPAVPVARPPCGPGGPCVLRDPCRVRRGGTWAGAARPLRGSDGACALRVGATCVPRTRWSICPAGPTHRSSGGKTGAMPHLVGSVPGGGACGTWMGAYPPPRGETRQDRGLHLGPGPNRGGPGPVHPFRRFSRKGAAPCTGSSHPPVSGLFIGHITCPASWITALPAAATSTVRSPAPDAESPSRNSSCPRPGRERRRRTRAPTGPPMRPCRVRNGAGRSARRPERPVASPSPAVAVHAAPVRGAPAGGS